MKNIQISRFLGLIVLAIGLVGCSGLSPLNQLAASKSLPPVKEVKSMLWVGNSFFYYNNSMHGHVGQLLNAAGQKGNRSTSATISGSGINWHDMEAHFKPNAVGSYSFVGDNEVRFNTFERPFDATMMMDCSQCPIHPKLQSIFYEYAKKHSETLRKHGSEPILFMSWAYSDVPAMTEQLAAEYIKAGQQNNALVVPAGYAFANSVSKRPDVSLIIADKRHPSLAGTYLAACTVLASVYKINPIGSKYLAGLSPEVAKHLQTVAWETSQAFHAKHGRGSLK
jgi:hypothetical protein